MAIPAEVAFRGPYCVIGSVGNVFITISRQRTDVDTLKRMRSALGNHFRRWPEGVGTFSVMESTAYSSNISPEEREEMARMSRDFSARGVALVVEGTGFKPAAIRTMLAGLYLLSRPTHPRKIFDTVDHACPWLVKHASEGVAGAVDAATLDGAIATLRAQLAAIE